MSKQDRSPMQQAMHNMDVSTVYIIAAISLMSVLCVIMFIMELRSY